MPGALFFGYLTDRFGRKRLFLITLALYLLATVATSVVMIAGVAEWLLGVAAAPLTAEEDSA